MTTLSTWGLGARDEPGLVQIIEQPSLMPKAVEPLDEEGIPEHILVFSVQGPDRAIPHGHLLVAAPRAR